MVRWIALLCGLIVGCTSGPTFETRAYQLHDRDSELLLIQGILQDELHQSDIKKLAEAVEQIGGRLRAIEVTDENVAIVRASRRGHHAIEQRLSELHRQKTLTVSDGL